MNRYLMLGMKIATVVVALLLCSFAFLVAFTH
jgi:hypothetical protein